MSKKFILDPLSWDYGELAKMAKPYGGPQKLINEIYNAGQVKGFIGGVIITGVTGITIAGVLKWLSSKKKEKIEEIISQENKIDDDSDTATNSNL